MKLSAIHESKPGALKDALRRIYGGTGRPMGITRPTVHNRHCRVGHDAGSRDGAEVTGDTGTPHKLRHRAFFRMTSGDGKVRY